MAAAANGVIGRYGWGRLLSGALGFGAVSLTIHDFIGSFMTIRGASMSPTLNPPQSPVPDRVFASVWPVRRPHTFRRGDVVVLHSPLERDPRHHQLVKRIIALPGDWVSPPHNPLHMTRIAPGHCWVEGDNPNASFVDSNAFGAVPLAMITARVSAVVWPPERIGWVRSVERSDRIVKAGSGDSDGGDIASALRRSKPPQRDTTPSSPQALATASTSSAPESTAAAVSSGSGSGSGGGKAVSIGSSGSEPTATKPPPQQQSKPLRERIQYISAPPPLASDLHPPPSVVAASNTKAGASKPNAAAAPPPAAGTAAK